MSNTRFHGDPGFYVRYFDMHVNSWIESVTVYQDEDDALSVAGGHMSNPEVREVEVWEKTVSWSRTANE